MHAHCTALAFVAQKCVAACIVYCDFGQGHVLLGLVMLKKAACKCLQAAYAHDLGIHCER